MPLASPLPHRGYPRSTRRTIMPAPIHAARDAKIPFLNDGVSSSNW